MIGLYVIFHVNLLTRFLSTNLTNKDLCSAPSLSYHLHQNSQFSTTPPSPPDLLLLLDQTPNIWFGTKFTQPNSKLVPLQGFFGT